jgi:predicted 3-demethylubiquinone-9 3-methyltransferase (glyoxalase superfamily)
MQRITTHLWFDKNAEEAMNYYVDSFNSVFKNNNSKIINITYYPENAQNEHLKGMDGKVLQGIFELEGQQFRCLDGGPIFQFNESSSLYVEVDSQEELDALWEKLSAVPESEQCGWCKDKFGLSWQIIPKRLGELMGDPDKEKSGRVMEALMPMHKIDIAKLEEAYNG